MKILHSTHTRPNYIPPPKLSEQEVVCGLWFPDQSDGGRVVSMATPKGDYDLAEVVRRLPEEQRPELTIIRADAKRENQPRNLASVPGRKVLLVGDTHHGATPIRFMLDYARAEPFDLILFDFTRQHAHFFLEAGLAQTRWLPGYNVERVAFDPNSVPQEAITLIAKMEDHFHSRRIAFSNAVVAAGLPIVRGQAPIPSARARHARSQISLNCSLNGDLNLRVFEVMIAGGFLLTDKLSPQAGLDLLFADGVHYAAYRTIPEGVERCKALLADPALTRKIAAAASARYEEILAPEKIKSAFFDLLDGRVRSDFDLKREPRGAASSRAADGELDRLYRRIALYEWVQEFHRMREVTTVLLGPQVPPDIVSDLADLSRVRLLIDGTAKDGAASLKKLARHATATGIGNQIGVLHTRKEIVDSVWRLIVATQADLRRPGIAAALETQARPALLLTDLADGPSQTTAEFLTRAGFRPQAEGSALLVRPGPTAP